MSTIGTEKTVPFLDLSRQHSEVESEIIEILSKTFSKSVFVLGDNVAMFESEWADYCGAVYCAGVNSGTDALTLALLASDAIKPGAGDEVITTAISAGYTALAILRAGAVPLFADVDPSTLLMDPLSVEAQITSRTKAIIPVHLYGQLCDMKAINEIAEAHKLTVIEDAAQAHGAWRSDSARSTAAFSFYPTKNLGACGDGGAVLSNDPRLVERVRWLRQGGHSESMDQTIAGQNSRLDEIQAAILRIKLHKLDSWNDERKKFADMYAERLSESQVVRPVGSISGRAHANHLYVVQTDDRDQLRLFLSQKGIETIVHYPKPLHLEKLFITDDHPTARLPNAEFATNRILSLPMNSHSFESEIEATCDAIFEFENQLTNFTTASGPHK